MPTPKTVLVVEDDHDTRVALRQSLEESGYFVVSAGTGAVALELLGNMSRPSVIILDINMPIMNGDQFLAVIRANEDFKSIPIIQISGGRNPQRPGTRYAFEKPIDMRDLVHAIEGCSVVENGH
jgi:CheY-like chemotaxis protein